MKKSDQQSNLMNSLKAELAKLAEKCVAAINSGADHASGHIKPTVDEFVKPSSVLAQKFSTALKGGAVIAGKQIIAAGIEFAESVKASRTKKQHSEKEE